MEYKVAFFVIQLQQLDISIWLIHSGVNPMFLVHIH